MPADGRGDRHDLEFSRARFAGEWVSVPMLDLVAPEAASLRAAADRIESLRVNGPVLVCCALGYGRSAAAVATWLLASPAAPTTLDDAVAQVRRVRPRIVLDADAQQAIAKAVELTR